MKLRIEISEQEEEFRIAVSGDVDLYTSPELRKAILKGVNKQGKHVAVNLQQVTYMDSSGVATLVEGWKAASLLHLAFVLVAPSLSVMKVLQLSRLDTVFAIRTEGDDSEFGTVSDCDSLCTGD